MGCSLGLVQSLAIKLKLEQNLRTRVFCWEVKGDPGAGDDINFVMDNFKCPECGYVAKKENVANLMNDAIDSEAYAKIDGKKLVCPKCETYSAVIASAHLLGADVWEKFELIGPRETVIQIRHFMTEKKMNDPVYIKLENPGAYYSGLMWFGGWAELYKKAYANKWNAPKYLVSDLMLGSVSALTNQGMRSSEIKMHIKKTQGIDLSDNQVRYRMYRHAGARIIPKKNKSLATNSRIFQEVEKLLYDDPSLSGSQICALLFIKGMNIALRTVNKYKKIILETEYWK